MITLPQQGSTRGSSFQVRIRDFTYMPETLRVKVGEEVTWINEDSVAHTVTSDAPELTFHSGDMWQRHTFGLIFNKTGEFAYYCVPHPYMVARIIVEP